MQNGDRPKRVFLVFAELGASTKLTKDGYAGGFVTVIVQAEDIRTSLDEAENALLDDGYEVRDFDKVLLFEPDEWAENEVLMADALRTAEDGRARYSPFNMWGH